MTDNRFKDFPTDYRFPGGGVDVRFQNFPIDGRFDSPGNDTRFMGSVYGGGGMAIGFSASRDEGTVGDLYVAKTGSDANPGTFGSPKLTISGAMAIATSGQEIKVRGGIYRETASFAGKSGTSGNRTTISRYGNEEVIISAAEPLSGFVACTIADQPDVGANWANMFKVTVPLTNFVGSDPRSAFPFEAGVRLLPATEWLPNPQYPGQQDVLSQWHTATTTVTSGGLITGYQHLPVTNLYTTAQIENADVLFHFFPNSNARTKVLSFTSGTINLTDTSRTYESNANKDKYALINLLPAMKKGQWGYRISGSDAILYVWPNNPGTINSAIEITRRGQCVVANTANHVELRGLILERASSAGTDTDGMYAYHAGGTTDRDGHVLENCLFRDTYRSDNGYAPIWIGNVDNWRIERCTVANAFGQFGLFCEGRDWNAGGMAVGGRLLNTIVDGSDKGTIRLFGQENCLVAFCRAYRSGLAAHANKGNYYANCHRVTFWGCDFRGTSGYLTWQEAGSIVVGFCDVPVSYNGSDGRAIVDQNSSVVGEQSPATEQGISGASYILNNITEPYADALANTNSISLGQAAETQVLYTGKNNILHGASTVDPAFLAASGWRNNVMTSGAGLAASAGTDTTALPADVYTNLSLGDVSIKSTSPTRSASTASIASEVAIFQGWYPDQTSVFTKDLTGATFNPATPPMGPYVNPDNQPALPAIWVKRPVLSGSLTDGSVLSCDDGYRIGTPWPGTPTFQWVRSVDGFTLVDIAGATSATYTLTGSDIGQYVGRRTTAGGDSVVTLSSAVIASSYPLGTPTLLALDKETSASMTSKSLESPTFTTNGTPIMVVVSTRNNLLVPNTHTVTLGNSGRTFGTGTSMTFQVGHNRTNNESQVFFLIAPGSAANQTVQVQSTDTTRGTQIAVFAVSGLTAMGANANTGNSATNTRTPTVTTLNANSGVIHIVNRFSGDLSDPISLTGCTQISNDNTGGNDLNADLAIAIGYEEAPTAGAYNATATWTTNRTVGTLSVELRS